MSPTKLFSFARASTARLALLATVALVAAQGTVLGLSSPLPARTAWSLDADGNGLDDALDQDLAAGRTGPVELFVHYGRRPTAADAKALEARGATNAYVFRHWDLIQVHADYGLIPTLGRAPGVTGVERFDPPVLDLDASARALRVRAAEGVPIVDGIDHSLAVQSDGGGPQGEGIVIAVIDSGIDNTHEALDDLDDNPATSDPKLVQKPHPITGLPLYAGAIVDTTVLIECVDPDDDHGHGTHVASIAAGTGGPSGTFRGMAPKARLVDVDVVLDLPFGHPVPDAVVLAAPEGIDWVLSFNEGTTCYGDPGDDRIDVVTMSISSGAGNNNANGSFNRMITDVVRSGVAFVQSAGNNGPGTGTLGAGAEGVITTANVWIKDTVARSDDVLRVTSSRGPRVSDGDADGLDELRPDIAAPGHLTKSAVTGSGSGYSDFTGTSAAAPHIAGIVALLLGVEPDLRPIDMGAYHLMGNVGAVPVRDVLQQTAQYKTAVESTPVQVEQVGKFGHLWNNGWGYGLVDAYAAVCLADASLDLCP